MTDAPDKNPGRPYQGPAGRTRVERVRVFRPGREPLEVEVFRVVNVAEYPELRAPALSGSLHRLDDGELLEVPFVFHDPAASQFVLVIPEGARGRELSERAGLLDSLRSEPDEDVPAYVRHFRIAYGHAALAEQVEADRVVEVDARELEPVDARHSAPVRYVPRVAGCLPDAGFAQRIDTDLTPLIADDRLWLFVYLSTDEHHAFTESASDLRLQLKTFQQVPVCVLTLVDEHVGAVRRAYLNPIRSVDGPILEMLGRDFAATVVVVDEAQRLLRSYRLEAPRTANAKMMLERTERMESEAQEHWTAAASACREAPPPIAAEEHPFIMREEAKTAAVALERLRALERWSAPDRIDEALLELSVPQTALELARRRILVDAARFGLAPSEVLLAQAVDCGLARDVQSLIEALCQRFDEIVPVASEHGLGELDVEANRAALDRLSAVHGTSTRPEVSCTIEHSG